MIPLGLVAFPKDQIASAASRWDQIHLEVVLSQMGRFPLANDWLRMSDVKKKAREREKKKTNVRTEQERNRLSKAGDYV